MLLDVIDLWRVNLWVIEGHTRTGLLHCLQKTIGMLLCMGKDPIMSLYSYKSGIRWH